MADPHPLGTRIVLHELSWDGARATDRYGGTHWIKKWHKDGFPGWETPDGQNWLSGDMPFSLGDIEHVIAPAEPRLRPALVALTGYARTGKDTVADYLVEHHGFARVAFADAVRELTGKLYGLPGDREWWQEHKADKWSSTITVRPGMAFPLGVLTSTSPGTGTLRDLLIHVGMNLRALDPDFWLRIALQAAERFRAAGQPVVITDCRFPNDAQAIVAAGGQIIRLHRRGCEPQGEADLAIDTIPPELIAGTVHNDGSIEALHLNIQISLRSRI